MPDNIKVSDAYVENEDFVPNPTDMHGRFRTSGIGPHQKIEEVAPIFEIDKVETADQIKRALDPDDDSVPRSAVVFPDAMLIQTSDTAEEEALRLAEHRLGKDVVIGGQTPAQREAAKEGSQGARLAQEAERSNAATNSVGGTRAGVHDDDDKHTVTEGKEGGKSSGSQRSGGQQSSQSQGSDDDEPKGQELDDALEKAGLPKTGSADEKRARLAEHQRKS